MPIIEVEGLEKTFKTRDRDAGLAGSLRSFVAPRYNAGMIHPSTSRS